MLICRKVMARLSCANRHGLINGKRDLEDFHSALARFDIH